MILWEITKEDFLEMSFEPSVENIRAYRLCKGL